MVVILANTTDYFGTKIHDVAHVLCLDSKVKTENQTVVMGDYL